MDDLDRLALVGGHPALDFVNSVEQRGRSNERDYVTTFADLVRWAMRAGLLTERHASNVRRRASSNASAAELERRDAVLLRETLYQLFLAIAAKRRPPSEALTKFNRHAAHVNKFGGLRTSDRRMAWAWVGNPGDPKRLQWELIQSATQLLVSETDRIRKCANDPCDWLFLDTSRNGQRRWCQMETCGNVSKAKSYRERHR